MSGIAHSDCFQWYLVTNDDIKELFLNFGPNLDHFWPKFGSKLAQNWVFGLYLDFDSHDLVEIAHSDYLQWYLVTNDDIKVWFLNFGPNLCHFRPQFGPKLGFGSYLDFV